MDHNDWLKCLKVSSLLLPVPPSLPPTVESKHPTRHRHARWLLTEVLSHRHRELRPSFRLGISGPPGAGKSTLIDKLGQLLTGQGHKVAVLVSGVAQYVAIHW